MLSLEHIKKHQGSFICRRCINRIYKAKLQPKECLYDAFPRTCLKCGEVHNIVMGLSIAGRAKLLLK